MLREIEIESIYKDKNGNRLLLPSRMAQLVDRAADSLEYMIRDVSIMGGKLYISDAFRSYADQKKAHDDYISGKKKAFSPPPGHSYHEAGRAIDIDLESLGISLMHFWEICKNRGWNPVIRSPDPTVSEAWHFEFLDHWNKISKNDYKQTKRCAVLECYVENSIKPLNLSDSFLLVQGYLKILDMYMGALDGIPGKMTKKAIAAYNIKYGDHFVLMDDDIIRMGKRVSDLWINHFPR